eukprot:SAG31_NODE_4601_length_3103_cov_4.716378_1_plen_672_part_00
MKKMEIQTVQKPTTATCNTERSIIFGAVLVLFTCTLIIGRWLALVRLTATEDGSFHEHDENITRLREEIRTLQSRLAVLQTQNAATGSARPKSCVGRVKHGRFEGRKCSESYDTVLREEGKDKADFWCSGDICDVSVKEEQCYCFSLCSDLPATEFWNATREVDIADPSSPWVRYFEAVYGGPVPLPIPLQDISLFYYQSPTWRSLFPHTANPFLPCQPTAAKYYSRCSSTECADWKHELRPSVKGGKALRKVLITSSLHQHNQDPSPAAAISLGFSVLNRAGRRLGKLHHGQWLEVTRTNVFDAGMYGSMMEEGVRLGVKYHINSVCGESMLCHTSFPEAFFWVVSGSGVWLRLNKSIGTVYTVNNAVAMVYRGAPGLTGREMGLGACPDGDWLRTGWDANRSCPCNDSWAYLNCKASRPDVRVKRKRARWGPWRLANSSGSRSCPACGSYGRPCACGAGAQPTHSHPFQTCTARTFYKIGKTWHERFLHYVGVSRFQAFDVCKSLLALNQAGPPNGGNIAKPGKYDIRVQPRQFAFSFVSTDEDAGDNSVSQTDRLSTALAYVLPALGHSAVDFVGRWEHLAEDLKALSKFFGQKKLVVPQNLSTPEPIVRMRECDVVAQDSICFGLTLPERCSTATLVNETCPMLNPNTWTYHDRKELKTPDFSAVPG